MKSKSFIAAAFLAAALAASAGTEPVVAPTLQPAAESSGWWWAIAPYTWITATEGDIGVAYRVAEVDISMSDTLESLDMAFMLALEGGYDRWAFGVDGVYADFSDTVPVLPGAPGPAIRGVQVGLEQFFARAHVGYRVIDGDRGDLTVFGGARYSHLGTDLTYFGPIVGQIPFSGSKNWVDPVIGAHGTIDLNDRWYLRGGGDIGGFGVSSDLIWQVNSTLGYRFTESLSGLIGYRAFGVDYSKGGFLIDAVVHGPVIGLICRF